VIPFGYVVRRVAVATGLLVALTFATFLIYYAVPASPGRILLNSAHPSSEDIALANHALGTDRPLVRQYVDWLGGVVHGDFGYSWLSADYDYHGHASGPAVTDAIIPATWVSLSIVAGGLVVLLALVVPLAALCASRPDSWLDRVTAGLLVVGISTHPLVVGILLQSFAANRLGLLPPAGHCTIRPAPNDNEFFFTACSGVGAWAQHLVLAWICFAIFFAALYVRVLRVSLLETLDEPYVSTARAKGASEARVLFGHALRNALRPVLTMTGMEAGTAVTILIYIEIVFGLPGLGRLSLISLNGDRGYDRPLIAAVVLFIGIAVFGINLLVDLLYPFVDRRVGQIRRAPRRPAPSSPTG
jgi:peptide/nickel transport system permease protein